MFQIVVGAREIGDLVAVEETRPITGGDLEEMIDRRGEGANLAAVADHRREEIVVGRLDLGAGLSVMIGQDVGSPMDEGVGRADFGPKGSGRLQAAAQDALEAGQVLGEPLFVATCSIEAWIASRRSTSLRPAAAKGGRPSSVSALRTA